MLRTKDVIILTIGLVCLVLLSTALLSLGGASERKTDVIRVTTDNYDTIVQLLAKREGLDLKNISILYNILYGGRPISIKAGILPKEIHGVSPGHIYFAAYIRGRGWIELPFIPYSDKIHFPGGDHYIISHKLGPNTTILLRLPPTMPSTTDPHKLTPDFARGSRGWYLLSIEIRDNIEIPIYLFIDPHIPNDRFYAYNIHTKVSTEWDSVFSVPGFLLLLKYVEKGEIDESNIKKIAYYITRNPIEYKGIKVLFECPWCPLPDGGGGPAPNYRESWPSMSGKQLSTTLSPGNNVVEFKIKAVNSDASYWSTVYPILYRIGVSIIAVPIETKWTEATINVSIISSKTKWALRSIKGYDTSIVYVEFSFPEGLAQNDLTNTFTLRIELLGNPDNSWKIIPRGYLDYELDDVRHYTNSYKSLFSFNPFEYIGKSSEILLKEQCGYKYKYMIPVPVPDGGFFFYKNYLFTQSSNISFRLNIMEQTASSNDYDEFSIKICIGSICKTKTTYLNNEWSEINFSYTIDEIMARDIVDYATITGYIPISVEITPVYIGTQSSTKLLLFYFKYPSRISIRVTHPILITWSDGSFTYTTLYNRDTIAKAPIYKDVLNNIFQSSRILVLNIDPEQVNKFFPTLIATKFGIEGIERVNDGTTYVYMEIKPTIPIFDDSVPYSDNYYTQYMLPTIREINMYLELGDVTMSEIIFVGDYDPGFGSTLPKPSDVLTKIITVTEIAAKIARNIPYSVAKSLSAALENIVTYIKIATYGYEVLRTITTNDVSVSLEGNKVTVHYQVAPYLSGPTDKGIIVEVKALYSLNADQTHITGVYYADVKTSYGGRKATYSYTREFSIYVPPLES